MCKFRIGTKIIYRRFHPLPSKLPLNGVVISKEIDVGNGKLCVWINCSGIKYLAPVGSLVLSTNHTEVL